MGQLRGGHFRLNLAAVLIKQTFCCRGQDIFHFLKLHQECNTRVHPLQGEWHGQKFRWRLKRNKPYTGNLILFSSASFLRAGDQTSFPLYRPTHNFEKCKDLTGEGISSSSAKTWIDTRGTAELLVFQMELLYGKPPLTIRKSEWEEAVWGRVC